MLQAMNGDQKLFIHSSMSELTSKSSLDGKLRTSLHKLDCIEWVFTFTMTPISMSYTSHSSAFIDIRMWLFIQIVVSVDMFHSLFNLLFRCLKRLNDLVTNAGKAAREGRLEHQYTLLFRACEVAELLRNKNGFEDFKRKVGV